MTILEILRNDAVKLPRITLFVAATYPSGTVFEFEDGSLWRFYNGGLIRMTNLDGSLKAFELARLKELQKYKG